MSGGAMIFDGTNWHPFGGSGGSGSSTFLGLTDTPSVFTGQAGKVVTVNTGEDALEFTAAAAGSFATDFAVKMSAPTTVANLTNVKIGFDTLVIDSNSEWDAVNKYWVCPTTGTYFTNAQLSWTANATGYRTIYIYVNGAVVAGTAYLNSGASLNVNTACIFKKSLTAGQYVEIYGRQSSGGNLDALVGSPVVEWQIWRIK